MSTVLRTMTRTGPLTHENERKAIVLNAKRPTFIDGQHRTSVILSSLTRVPRENAKSSSRR